MRSTWPNGLTGTAMHLPGAADQFGIGVAAALLFLARGAPDATRDPRWARASNGLVVAGLAGLVGAQYALDALVGLFWRPTFLFYTWHSFTALAVAALVGGVATRGPFARAIFENRPAVWLGTISYSIYLWHPVVAGWIDGGGAARTQGRWVFALVAVPAVVAVSAASYYLVERPFLRRKRGPRPAERTLQ